ncbi:hypothetical protein SAMN05877809_103356 [Rhodobacter sp. JA431]|uniref:hypothetical protein n=1 Tax=Rhodobacter sp. JA431 TaxID=570013 RepID=UPI000BD35C3D|nr:hypothetical protein [Rhodobacter sp. JA431]SOC04980.1 hypothetical protein SAMN05877809_103356 [Rhodobacter sp. JA431]
MKPIFLALAGLLAVSACADRYLDESEASVVATGQITANSTLSAQADFARRMSSAYVSAARRTTTAQDVASFGVFLAAASAVDGAIGTASDTVVARRAITGATLQQGAKRTVPKTAIQGIYTGAKRLNCVATVAQVGVPLLSSEDATTIRAARAFTFGAVQEVMITTREGLVREVADYKVLVTAMTDAIDLSPSRAENTKGRDAGAFDINALKRYTDLLANCLEAQVSLSNAASDLKN